MYNWKLLLKRRLVLRLFRYVTLTDYIEKRIRYVMGESNKNTGSWNKQLLSPNKRDTIKVSRPKTTKVVTPQ